MLHLSCRDPFSQCIFLASLASAKNGECRIESRPASKRLLFLTNEGTDFAPVWFGYYLLSFDYKIIHNGEVPKEYSTEYGFVILFENMIDDHCKTWGEEQLKEVEEDFKKEEENCKKITNRIFMKNLYSVLALVGACCVSSTVDQSFGQEVNSSAASAAAASSSLSADSPIILAGITKYDEIKYMQQDYVRKNYEDYRIISTGSSLPKSKGAPFIQSFILRNDEGKEIEVLFDISDAYKARKKKCNVELKKIVEDLENLEKNKKELHNKMSTDKVLKEKMNGIKKSLDKAFAEELKKLEKSPEELTEEDKKNIVKSINESMKEEMNSMKEEVSKRLKSSK